VVLCRLICAGGEIAFGESDIKHLLWNKNAPFGYRTDSVSSVPRVILKRAGDERMKDPRPPTRKTELRPEPHCCALDEGEVVIPRKTLTASKKKAGKFMSLWARRRARLLSAQSARRQCSAAEKVFCWQHGLSA
jgi:hypothetical protein